MHVSIFGILVALIGMGLLLRGSLTAMLVFVLGCSLLGAAEAFGLTFLGGASVQPASFALVFLGARALLDARALRDQLKQALIANWALGFFCLYSAVTAFILPKVFAGTILVSPMRTLTLESLYDVFPLRFSSQNVTTAFYILGTGVASLIATMAAAQPRSKRLIVGGSIAIAWIHLGFGVLSVVLAKTGKLEFLDLFRNASYAQLDQTYEGFFRISGIFAETSAYAEYAFVWFVLMSELWFRNISTRATGVTAAALAIILVLSTSGTAYISMFAYGVLLLGRMVLFPGGLPLRKWLMVGGVFLAVVVVALAMATLMPSVATALGEMFRHMTIDKMNTTSGEQRKFWALQGVNAFKVSHGLGIGSGSFRSSSILTAIIGSTGVVGLAAFAAHCLAILKPWRRSTFLPTSSSTGQIGAAASWTACLGLLPAFISSPTPDPGLLFAVFGGLALGWRMAPSRAPVRVAGTGKKQFADELQPAAA